MNHAVKRTAVRAFNTTFEHATIKSELKSPNVFRPTHGFSLVELLVVVAILAILAAIAIPLFLNQRSKAAQGATQSDSRNLATNLNTLFANLPRSADPNVALNGSTAVDATLSGSGTISVGGETLNVNLSPDVTITKTGNADPAVGAGLKITHAGVEDWACVIPLPFSVAYAQTVTFQPACGTVVSEAGNLLTANQATGTDALGTTVGIVNAGASVITSDTTEAYQGSRSAKAAVGSGTLGFNIGSGSVAALNPPVVAGQTYTFAVRVKTSVDGRSVVPRIFWRDGSIGAVSNVTGTILQCNSSSWTLLQMTAVAPANAEMAIMELTANATGPEDMYIDAPTFHQGDGGTWAPPGTPIVQP